MFKLSLVRYYSLSNASCKNYYETLGVKRTSTIAEIKSAYYKLSLKHHPDRQDGSREEFEKITNAYKVLGDHHSRKLYDRGAFAEQKPTSSAPRNYYSQSAPNVRRPDVPTGPSPIYDFDMWSRFHYGDAFSRRRAAKMKYEDKISRSSGASNSHAHKPGDISLSVLATFLLTIVAFAVFSGSFDDFDKSPDTAKK